jgi:hypothetical protein
MREGKPTKRGAAEHGDQRRSYAGFLTFTLARHAPDLYRLAARFETPVGRDGLHHPV